MPGVFISVKCHPHIRHWINNSRHGLGHRTAIRVHVLYVKEDAPALDDLHG